MHGLTGFEMALIDIAVSPVTYLVLIGLVVIGVFRFVKKQNKRD